MKHEALENEGSRDATPETEPRSPLHRMTLEHPTELWSDGCEPKGLLRAIEHGATGATSNPVLVLECIEAAPDTWAERAKELLLRHPRETEEQIAWRLVDRAAEEGADLLRPVFDRTEGRRGRMSAQVNPRNYPDGPAMLAQAEHFFSLRPNMAVKLPAVGDGLWAIEEAIALGIPVNATVLFTLPQAVAVAEAMERGRARAKDAGRPEAPSWVTIMVGRLDDHLRDVAAAESLAVDPEVIRQASTAVVRKAYGIFRARGYRSLLLAAAMRSHHHWSEFIGGSMVITIPPSWQEKFNAAGVEVRARIEDPVDPAVVATLSRTFVDFRRAYDEDGMRPAEFVEFGAARKTLHQFIGGYERLLAFVRRVMLPL